ncbi:MAG: ComF family protein, partial [Gammaproteobacteria bacterium]|nr:ComF family protein [Gammaproteobacteria bacterium]
MPARSRLAHAGAMLPRYLNARFPGSCHLCAMPVSGQLDLCADCRAELPWLVAACTHCAAPLLLPPGTRGACGRCQVKPPPMTSTTAVFRYRYPMDRLVQRFKFERGMAEGRLLASLFAETMAARSIDRPEALLPVPLHPARERERGFNQSEFLAGALSKALEIPIENKSLQRVRYTDVQSGLDRKARRRNLRNAFVARGDFPGHVAIIDDVTTTGATLEEVARVLLKAGAQRVDAWVLARTPGRIDQPWAG